jgi:phosphate transport system substrate-binding protein
MDDRVSLEVLGFGEAMPLACDDSALGRHANRRVEVWLR